MRARARGLILSLPQTKGENMTKVKASKTIEQLVVSRKVRVDDVDFDAASRFAIKIIRKHSPQDVINLARAYLIHVQDAATTARYVQKARFWIDRVEVPPAMEG